MLIFVRELEKFPFEDNNICSYQERKKALNPLVDAVMKKTKGGADARTVREVLIGKLAG